MNPGIDEARNPERDFDRATQALHATALGSLSPQTLSRLRAARHAAQATPRKGHAWRWATATAFSAVLAVTLGVQLMPRTAQTPPAQPVAVAPAASSEDYGDALATLDENPDLYVWLASAEAEPLAME